MAEELKRQGWFLKPDTIKECQKKSSVKNPSAKDIIKEALDLDLRQHGIRGFPKDFKEKSKITGPLVVQLQKIHNVSAPHSNPDSNHAPPLLKVILADGDWIVQGIIMDATKDISLQTPPGSKLLLSGDTKVKSGNGLLLLQSAYIKVLGGEVEELKKKWMLSKGLGNVRRNNIKEDGPPPFLPFEEMDHVNQKPATKEKQSRPPQGGKGATKGDASKHYNGNDSVVAKKFDNTKSNTRSNREERHSTDERPGKAKDNKYKPLVSEESQGPSKHSGSKSQAETRRKHDGPSNESGRKIAAQKTKQAAGESQINESKPQKKYVQDSQAKRSDGPKKKPIQAEQSETNKPFNPQPGQGFRDKTLYEVPKAARDLRDKKKPSKKINAPPEKPKVGDATSLVVHQKQHGLLGDPPGETTPDFSPAQQPKEHAGLAINPPQPLLTTQAEPVPNLQQNQESHQNRQQPFSQGIQEARQPQQVLTPQLQQLMMLQQQQQQQQFLQQLYQQRLQQQNPLHEWQQSQHAGSHAKKQGSAFHPSSTSAMLFNRPSGVLTQSVGAPSHTIPPSTASGLANPSLSGRGRFPAKDQPSKVRMDGNQKSRTFDDEQAYIRDIEEKLSLKSQANEGDTNNPPMQGAIVNGVYVRKQPLNKQEIAANLSLEPLIDKKTRRQRLKDQQNKKDGKNFETNKNKSDRQAHHRDYHKSMKAPPTSHMQSFEPQVVSYMQEPNYGNTMNNYDMASVGHMMRPNLGFQNMDNATMDPNMQGNPHFAMGNVPLQMAGQPYMQPMTSYYPTQFRSESTMAFSPYQQEQLAYQQPVNGDINVYYTQSPMQGYNEGMVYQDQFHNKFQHDIYRPTEEM